MSEAFEIERDGERNLAFNGVEVGDGEWCDEQGGWTLRVTIYRVVAQKPCYVVHSRRWGSVAERNWSRAEVCWTPGEVLEALTVDGRLGAASKAAWDVACEHDAELAPFKAERVG